MVIALKEFASVLLLIASTVRIFAANRCDAAFIVAEMLKVCSILCSIADRHIRRRRRRRFNVQHRGQASEMVEMGDPMIADGRAEVQLTVENEESTDMIS